MRPPSWLARSAESFRRHIDFIGWLALAAIWLVDLRFPAAYAVPLLYVPVALVGLAARSPLLVLQLAAGATLLTVLHFVASLGTGDWQPVLFNQTLAIVTMWITAVGVTMYRRAADRRLESLRAFEDVSQALDQAAIVSVTDVTGRIKAVNDKLCQVSKYSREELIGQDHRLLNSGYHSKEFIRDLWDTIGQGRIWRGDIRNRAKGGSIYWVDTTIVPTLDERGRPWQYMAIRYDITERKNQEQRLRDQAALAALGEFSAVVAHEVRNPLAGIRSGVQLITSELPAGSDGISMGRDIVARIDGLNRVIEDLLMFARPRAFKSSSVAIRSFLADMAAWFKQDPAMAGIDVELTGDADLTIEADVNQLPIVFLNLLMNGGQAMEGKGRIDVAVDRIGADACAISIADHGPGIPDGLHAKVFEPFFTTKHRGTGLGLPIVKRIVEAHHGAITMEPRPGGGTIVHLTLPRRQPDAVPV